MNTVVNNASTVTNDLRVLVRSCYVGIDTATFMHPACGTFFAALRKALRAENSTCFTIGEVFQELQKNAESEDQEKAAKAKNGLQLLHQMTSEKLMTVYEPAAVKKSFADPAWLSLFSQMRTRHELALITQDANLAIDVLEHVNGAGSVQGTDVKVRRINGDGRLAYFHFIRDENGKLVSKPIAPGKLPVAEDFLLPPIDVDEGTVVYGLNRTPYMLDEEMTCGSEGSIWRVKDHSELLIKLFHAPTNNKFEKLKVLCTKTQINGAVLPKDIIFDAAYNFGGYLMEKVDGVSVESLFTLRGQQRNAPHWNRRDFAVLARSISGLCADLLNEDILVGDVSAVNFLVGRNKQGKVDPSIVYAIDLDSAQVVGRTAIYPADGITYNYAAPEILRGGIKSGDLRTRASLSYAVSVLTLQIILCGVHPFRICSGDADATVQDAMKAETLPFGTHDVRRSGVAPSGVEKLWSNMPKGTKDFYHSILQKDMTRNAPAQRPSLQDISKALDGYIRWLDDAANLRDYPESLSLDPQELKPFYAVCATRGCTSPKFKVVVPKANGKYFCPTCRDKWENGIDSYRRCSCGKVFAVKNCEKRLNPQLCPSCRDSAAAKDAKTNVFLPFYDAELAVTPKPAAPSKPVVTPKPVATPKPAADSRPAVSHTAPRSTSSLPAASRLRELLKKIADL